MQWTVPAALSCCVQHVFCWASTLRTCFHMCAIKVAAVHLDQNKWQKSDNNKLTWHAVKCTGNIWKVQKNYDYLIRHSCISLPVTG